MDSLTRFNIQGAILEGLFVGDGSFFEEHDGDIVAHGVDAAANRACKPALIGEGLNVFFADRTDEDFEFLLRECHADHLLRFFWDCSRGRVRRATSVRLVEFRACVCGERIEG